MTVEQATVFAILAGALVLFVWERWRYDVVALCALFVAVAAGVVPANDAFRGFADPVVTTVACVFVMSAAVRRSGAIEIVVTRVSRWLAWPSLRVFAFSSLVATSSAFMNNVGALALFMPAAFHAARRAGRSPSELLMPMAFASLLGGLITLIGTPPNLLIANIRAQYAGVPFAMFDFTPVGLAVAVAGTLYLAIGWRLLPRDRRGTSPPEASFHIEDYTAEARVPEGSPFADKKLQELERLGGGDLAVVGLVRDGYRQLVPAGYTILVAGDILTLETDPMTLKSVVDQAKLELLGSEEFDPQMVRSDVVGVVEAVLTERSMLIGQTPERVRLRDRFGVNLLAARHSGHAHQRLSRIRFAPGDVIVLQGRLDTMPDTLGELGCLPLAQRNLGLGRRRRTLLPLAILLGAVAAASSGVAPVAIAFMGGVLLILLARLLTLREFYEAIDWPVIMLLGAMIPVTEAMQTTGGAALIASAVARLAPYLSPLSVVGVVLVATMLITPVLNNAATVLIMAPIAADLAIRLGLGVDALLMAVAVGASCDFLSPIGHQSNTLVMGPGGYRFTDYWRLGLPLSLIVIAVAVPAIAHVWPLVAR